MFLSSLPRTTTTGYNFLSTVILARTFIKHLVSIAKIGSAHTHMRFSVPFCHTRCHGRGGPGYQGPWVMGREHQLLTTKESTAYGEGIEQN
jgi:hypothetical protein